MPDPMTTLSKRLGALKVIAVAAFSLTSGGFAVAMYLDRFALAATVDKHAEQNTEVHKVMERKLAEHETSIAVTQEIAKRIEEDIHWQRQQTIQTARSMGVPIVPVPIHK
jgi:hypothetical protein